MDSKEDRELLDIVQEQEKDGEEELQHEEEEEQELLVMVYVFIYVNNFYPCTLCICLYVLHIG